MKQPLVRNQLADCNDSLDKSLFNYGMKEFTRKTLIVLTRTKSTTLSVHFYWEMAQVGWAHLRIA